MSACGSSFFVSCALLLYILYLSFFPFSYMHLFASFSPRLCEKNRKSWPALQHRFIYIFFSFFFCRRFLAFDWPPIRPVPAFSSPSISFWSNGLPAILTKWRNRPFIVIPSADRLFAKRNFITEEVQRDTPVWDRAHLADLSEKYKNFNLYHLIWRLYPKKYIYANSKYRYLYKFSHNNYLQHIYT